MNPGRNGPACMMCNAMQSGHQHQHIEELRHKLPFGSRGVYPVQQKTEREELQTPKVPERLEGIDHPGDRTAHAGFVAEDTGGVVLQRNEQRLLELVAE